MKINNECGVQRLVKHGIGKIKWKSGAIYDGQWHENKMHGSGKLIHVNNEVYEGEFVEDKANGFGKYIN